MTPVRTTLSAALALGLLSGTGVLAAAPAAAVTCKPTPGYLKTIVPKVQNLAGGAQVRIWDTGATPTNPRAATRIVATRIPASSVLKPHVGIAGPLTTSATTSTQLNRDPAGIAMINADFFHPVRRALPIHAQVRGGGIEKGESALSHTVVINPLGKMRLDRVAVGGTVTIGTTKLPITGINWQRVSGAGVNVYTPSWGSQSRPYGTVDVVVASGKVVEVRTSGRGAAPKAGQRILTAAGTLLSGVRVGQAASVTPTVKSESGGAVRGAVGHGARYLRNGLKDGGPCTTVEETLRPRSAIGWNAAGDTFLVTVSGRSYENGVLYGGATTHQMPDYLAQLGLVNAVALDGGGSTTMSVRSAAGGVTRRIDHANPLAAQRPVPNTIYFR